MTTLHTLDREPTVSITIPKTVVSASRLSPDELRIELAIYLFQQQKLSFGKAREMAGMTIWDFQTVLSQRGISVHYDLPEYDADMKTLQELGFV